jgi:hypothetical protein
MYKPWERFIIGTGYGRMTPRFMGIAEAIVIGGVVAAGAGIYAATSASSSAANATAEQQAAASNANATQQQQFNTQQANIAPWLQAGTGAVNQLAAGTQPGGQFSTVPTFQFDQSKIQQDPGYAFRTQQGVNALTAAGSAAGNLGSGNLGTALVNYGQQAGSQEYSNAYNRAYQQQQDTYNSQIAGQTSIYNRLAGVAQTGQTANSQLSSAGQNMANQVGNNLMTAATNSGQFGIQGQQNTIQGVNSISNQLMGGLQAYNAQNNLNNYQTAQQNNMSYNPAGGGYGYTYNDPASVGPPTSNAYGSY